MKIALAGNPNSGKTTLFNALTGATAHVGNWPGVTVEKRSGFYKRGKERYEILDLPGIYSLSPYTPEEIISRNELVQNEPDVIIDIVDATNLERNLYLSTQLLELDIPVVVALNMVDVLEKNDKKVDVADLSRRLGVPVISISALKSKGLKELMDTVIAQNGKTRKGTTVLGNTVVAQAVSTLAARFPRHGLFFAAKAIEGDELVLGDDAALKEAVSAAMSGVDISLWDNDLEACIAALKYDYITEQWRVEGVSTENNASLTKSDKIDKVLTHKIWGIPIFIGIMFLVFHLTFSENLFGIGWILQAAGVSFDIPVIGTDTVVAPGVMVFNAMELFTGWLTELMSGALPEGTWYTGLILDGVAGGLFSVLSFVPQILVLFLFLSILEDTGYMARVAFLLDRALRRFGLSGRACMPLIMCFGCAVPGIMATRTLTTEKERKIAILLSPFFSCGAKLPIWAAFGACLFGGAYSDLIVFGVYFLGIAVAIGSAILLSISSKKEDMPTFIMELPAYHAPRFRNTVMYLWDKLKHYLFKAATIILGSVIVIWFLTNFGFEGGSFGYGVNSGNSLIGIVAKWFSWLFVPLGFGMGENGWQFVVAAFTGLIAKEMVVGTLGVFAGVEGDALELEGAELAGGLFGSMIVGMTGGWQAAIAFMAFNLLSIPCMAAVGAARGELAGKKNFWFALGYWLVCAYVVSAALFWGLTYWWIGLILGLILVGLIIWGVVRAVRSNKKQKALDAAQDAQAN